MSRSAIESLKLAINLLTHARTLHPPLTTDIGETRLLLEEAASVIRAAALSPVIGDIGVEPLEWGADLEGEIEFEIGDYDCVIARTPFGNYSIVYGPNSARAYWGNRPIDRAGCASLEVAKHVAQTHFEDGLRKTLKAFPAALPAFWLAEAPPGESSSGPRVIGQGSLTHWLTQGAKCTPYYPAAQALPQETAAIALESLGKAETAITDWLNLYAPEHCNSERAAEAVERVNSQGVIAYVADVLASIRAGAKALKDPMDPAEVGE